MKYNIKITLAIVLYLTGRNIVNAQSNSQKLDSLFKVLHSYGQINGNVLAAENGQPIYKKSFGYSNFETKTPHNENSIMSLASITKTFTAIATLQLKEKGKLKLDDSVKKYLKDFPYPDITIRNLLSHTSGLPDWDLFEEEIKNNPNKIFTNKDVLPSLKVWKKPLENKPYEKWEYSNINYVLLAIIIEKITGIGYQEYVRQHIFVPAKMYNTSFKMDSVALVGKHKSINYIYPFKYSSALQNVDSIERFHWNVYCLRGIVGQGNGVSTTDDLFKFDQILYSGKLLKTSTLEEAFTPTKLTSGEYANADINIGKASYGLGWFVFDDKTNGKVVWHTGGVPGALSILLRNIDKKQTVIILDNTFSSGIYKNGVNAMNILNNKPIVKTKQSLTRIYGSTLVNKGIDIAFVKFQELRDDTTHFYYSEEDMNDLGYQLLYGASFNGHNELALEVLKQNILLFPNSSNTYDSYGEALAKNGKKEEAIYMYRKSIKLNPENESGKTALEELLKK
jgi:CubicO group peptidase (beta-lactamase class C family)